MKNQATRTTASGEALISAFLHARSNRAGIPLSGTFELTPRCNFNCRMCYVHENVDENVELSTEQWLELGRKARDAGMLFLLLTGGEPFMRKDFAQLYTELRRMGLMLSVNTNGSMLTDELLEVLRRDPPTRINVTLYGGSNQTYRELCRNEAFDTVVRNILRMKEAGLTVKINCSVTPYNAKDILYIYDFAKAHGMQIQTTTYMYPPVRINGGQYGQAPERFTAEDAAAYMLLCREQTLTPEQLAASADSPIDEECARDSGDPMSCRAGRTTFWISWSGHMVPCGTMPSQGGYDLRTMDFLEAWHRIRQDVLQIRMPRECAGCGLKSRCITCAAACIAETGGTSEKPEYICRFTHRLRELTAEKYPLGGNDHEAES